MLTTSGLPVCSELFGSIDGVDAVGETGSDSGLELGGF